MQQFLGRRAWCLPTGGPFARSNESAGLLGCSGSTQTCWDDRNRLWNQRGKSWTAAVIKYLTPRRVINHKPSLFGPGRNFEQPNPEPPRGKKLLKQTGCQKLMHTKGHRPFWFKYISASQKHTSSLWQIICHLNRLIFSLFKLKYQIFAPIS